MRSFRTKPTISSGEQRIKILEGRLKIAIECLTKISEGDQALTFLDVEVSGEDEESNQFRHALQRTKQQLVEYVKKDQQRMWAAEGMAKFIELIQGDRSNKNFFDNVLSAIVRFVNANQGGIFLLNERDPQDVHLELKACYAYGKKKFLETKIGIGQGILGQAFLEKETSVFLEVPNNYFDITSGLGEATPRFLLIVPLKYDHQIVGIMELASFQKMEKYQTDFVEKIGENLASVILNIQHASKATNLYEESQQHAKALLEREEMLRQSVEELETTQEEMKRHQKAVEERTQLMKFIIDNIPVPIFLKDEKGRYSMVNKSELKLFNVPENEIIGKDDSHFVASNAEWKVIKESDEAVLSSDQPLELPMQNFTTENGTSHIFKTTKIPFTNNVTGKKNILGVSIDLTEKLTLEKKLLHEININATNTLINLSARQRMLSQKIGFYAEMVVKGKADQINELKNCIHLFEHSLQVIKDGGYPMGIACENPLPAADATLTPYLQDVYKTWTGYKDAANKIVHYSSSKDAATPHVRREIENGITFIEDNAEILLEQNNAVMLACIQANEARSVEA